MLEVLELILNKFTMMILRISKELLVKASTMLFKQDLKFDSYMY